MAIRRACAWRECPTHTARAAIDIIILSVDLGRAGHELLQQCIVVRLHALDWLVVTTLHSSGKVMEVAENLDKVIASDFGQFLVHYQIAAKYSE